MKKHAPEFRIGGVGVVVVGHDAGGEKKYTMVQLRRLRRGIRTIFAGESAQEWERGPSYR